MQDGQEAMMVVGRASGREAAARFCIPKLDKYFSRLHKPFIYLSVQIEDSSSYQIGTKSYDFLN
jgi:hypothetical protein